MPLLFTYSTVGPPSIPIKQINNNKVTDAKMSMPFKPDTMTQGSDFSNGREVYITKGYNNIKKRVGNSGWYSSSQITDRKKSIAIGKSSTGAVLPPKQEFGYAYMDKNDVKDGLRRCRAGGCVAPKKVGANY
jgi:hypothetical protein